MSPSLSETYAERVKANMGLIPFVDDDPAVEFDPFTILISLIGLAMQCWTFRNSHTNQTGLHGALVQTCEDAGERKRLVRHGSRLYRKRSHAKLSKARAVQMVEATIQTGLDMTPAEMCVYSSACGNLSSSDKNIVMHIVETDDAAD